jgi:adenylate kinase
VAPKRNEVVQSLSNTFNYKVISVEEVLADKIKSTKLRDSGWLSDEEISLSVYDALKKTEKHHRGVILSGFPSNL